MLEQRLHPGPGEREQVIMCLRDLRIARADLQAARGDRNLRWQTHALRGALLSALENYAAAITALGAPVPHRLRIELDLYRGLQRRG